MEEGWERPPRVELPLHELQALLEPAFPGVTVAEHAVLAAGLSNTNVRFRLQGDPRWYVLRLHTREARAAAKERAVMRLLAADGAVPVPPLLYSEPDPASGRHPYSIWGFSEGSLLQELFGALPAGELLEIAAACGRTLAVLGRYRFASCGELDAGLQVVEEYGAPSQYVPELIARALFEGRAGERLGAARRSCLWSAVERTRGLLSVLDDKYTLVHGDYKRSNLLMTRQGGTWQVAAVLDWEFTFAGPALTDVGLFLRAGRALPPGFREAFVEGYRDEGGNLPEEWRRLSRLVDLVSQLMFLQDPEEKPRRFAETTRVVEETIELLGG